MMATKFVVFALLFASCSYASPIKMATILGSSLLVLPILVEDLNEPQAMLYEDPTMRMLNGDSKIAEESEGSFDVQKRSAEEIDDDDLETAAGTNVLRPLFVYRQQVAYRQRAREAIRRGRRI